jgi:hypothetical protein
MTELKPSCQPSKNHQTSSGSALCVLSHASESGDFKAILGALILYLYLTGGVYQQEATALSFGGSSNG